MNQMEPVNLLTAGDEFFAGVDQRNPLIAVAGVLADGENLRFTNGLAETRRGVAKPGWGNFTSGSTVSPHGTPYGAGVFRDPNSREFGLLASDGYAWRILPHNGIQSIALPSGVKLLTETVFVQAFNKVYAFRGRYLAPLRLADFDVGFLDLVPQYDSTAIYAALAEVAYGPFAAIDSITRDGGTATVTTASAHGYITGADITIRNAIQTDYNGRFNITVTNDITFTYALTGAPATPANQITVTSITRIGSTATVTRTAHGFTSGTSVLISGATETAYNGTFVISNVTANTFDYTPSGDSATPATGSIIATQKNIQCSNMAYYYRALGTLYTLTSITRSGTTATATKAGHGFTNGQSVTISGAAPTDYNGTFVISNVTANTFDFTVTGAPATPATGTILCRNASTISAHTPDANPADWQRIYHVLPNAATALYINNRLLVPTAYEPASADNYATFNGGSYVKTDFIVATDYLDETHFSFADEFRINQGSDDEIVDLFKFAEDSVIVFKGRSWGILSGVAAIDNGGLSLDFRETGYGLASRGGAVKIGSDVFFYAGSRGIVSIKHTENGKLISVDVPLSAPIARTLARINAPLAGTVRLTSWQNKLYCAVPLDNPGIRLAALPWENGAETSYATTQAGSPYEWAGSGAGHSLANGTETLTAPGRFVAQANYVSTANAAGLGVLYPLLTQVNTAVLVYDFVSAQRVNSPLDESARLGWTPLDTGAALTVKEWVKLTLNGEERLFFFSNDGWFNLYEEREDGDEVADATTDTGLTVTGIATRALTRGYYGNVARSFMRPIASTVAVRTWHPTYSVTAVFEGVNKELALATEETRDRTKYFRPFNAAAWDETNVNDDHATPYREDYSVAIPAAGFNFGDGVDLDLVQSVTESHNINARQGRYLQLEITNTTGRLQLCGTKLEAIPNHFRRGTHT